MRVVHRVACALTTAMVVWGFPASVLACPVCFSAKDEANRVAFVASTAFLTALPLILMGAFIGWAARRAKALDAPPLDSPSDAEAFLPRAARAALAPSAEPSGPHSHAVVPRQFAARAESPERTSEP
jgi:hypothetical protein